MENQTVVSEFILLGILNTKGLETTLFIFLLAFYLCTFFILSAIFADSHLHTPMYFFLCNLSVVDLGFCSITTPKLLAILWAKSKTFSLGGYISKVFFSQILGCTECLLCTITACDRYVAICHPLCYLIIMNWKVYVILAAGTWITSSFHATILTSLTFTLPYCGPNVVDYFLCDIFPVVKLTCADTYVIEILTLINTGVLPMTCFLLLILSYICIVYSTLKMHSAIGRGKAAATCISHMMVVRLFFGPCALIYTQTHLSKVMATAVHLFGYIATPLLNPIIYMLRNKEAKDVLRKLTRGHMTAL